LPASRKISKNPGGIFDPDGLIEKIHSLEQQTGAADFWQNREHAESTLSALKRLRATYDPWRGLRMRFQDVKALFDLAVEEGDESVAGEIGDSLEKLRAQYEQLKLLQLLGEENDALSAFLTIHSGAGGTEACDWVSMLLRMYTRWAENRGFSTAIIDILEAEGGIKSVTVEVTGEYAYGFLKSETGIHRLVRISPFDSSSRRHTSFASVFATPVIDDTIEVEINPEELRVDTYRAGGAGGQHVNKTDSAVRITHLPTGIVVQCQNERSQHKNKAMAMKVLRSRLYEHYREQQEAEREKQESEKKDIAWGNQIRSYVFHPYSMVKDHRTKVETGNVQAVMDGDIDRFIEAYLMSTSGAKKQWA
jgi:peptide chain release factor 2